MGFMYGILLMLCEEQRITKSCDGCEFVLLKKVKNLPITLNMPFVAAFIKFSIDIQSWQKIGLCRVKHTAVFKHVL